MVQHLPRLALTLLAVAVASALLGATLVLTATLGGDAARVAARSTAGRDVIVQGRAGAGGTLGAAFGLDRSLVDADTLARVRAVEGVAAAEGEIRARTTISDETGAPLSGSAMLPMLAQGWLGGSPLDQWTLVEGRGPQGPEEAVVDRGTAEAHHLQPGDRIGATGADGAVHPLRVVGVARGIEGDANGPAGAVLVDPTMATSVFLEPGHYSSIGVRATSGTSATALRDRIAGVLPSQARAMTAAEQAAVAGRSLAATLTIAQRFLLGFSALAVLLAAHAVANSFSILLAQRRQELATLRLLGVSPGRLVTSVGIEAAVLGVLAGGAGLVSGVLLGALATAGLRTSGLAPAGGSVQVSTPALLGAAALVASVTVLAATLPAAREACRPPVEALRQAEVGPEPRRRRRATRRWAAVGLVLALGATSLAAPGDLDARHSALVAAALVLGLLVAAPTLWTRCAEALEHATGHRWTPALRMATANLARRPERTGRLVTAVLATVTVLVGLSVASATTAQGRAEEVARAVRADLVLRPESGAAVVPQDAAAATAALPTVASTTGVGLGAAEADDHPAAAVGIDPIAMGGDLDLRVVEGRASDLAPDAIATTVQAARENGWTVGSTVTGEFVATGYERLRIVALVEGELPSATGVPLLMTKADLARRVPPERRGDALVFVRLRPGVDVAAARRSIDALLVHHPTVRTATLADIADTGTLPIAPVADALSALVLIATAIALLGVANTMLLTTLGRVRELGLLRAIGMGRRQVASMMRWETLVSAGATTIAGAIAGVLVGGLLARSLATGTGVVALPWLRIVAVVAGALLASLMATLASTQRVARIPVLDAISAR